MKEEEMEWMPIETYDALKEKPKHAVFYVKATQPKRPGGHTLREMIVGTRTFGLREITLWLALPPPPKEQE
jgi:hypothetical protein